MGGLSGVLRHLSRFVSLMLLPEAVLVAELLAAEGELAACVDAAGARDPTVT